MKLQKVFRNWLAPQLVLALSMYAACACADVVVVVSAKSAVTRLTAGQVTNIFLGKTDTFPNGGHAVPYDQIEGSPIRNEFYSRIANKSSAQMSAYWTKIIFTGNGYPPAQQGDSAGVKKAVADNPNAIGYIDRSLVDSSIRIVLAP